MAVRKPAPQPAGEPEDMVLDLSDDSSSSASAADYSITTGSESDGSSLPPPASAPDGPTKLPEKRSKLRRATKYPFFSPYRRLALTIALINCTLLFVGIGRDFALSLSFLGYMTISNIFVSIMIRNQHIINLLFWLAICPRSVAPLWMRWSLGKVYHFGGLHSGCSVAGSIWFAIFTVTASVKLARGSAGVSGATVLVTYQLLLLLAIMIILALPKNRARYHNTFEASHRFLGWTSLALFWVHTGLFINDGRDPAAYTFLASFIRSPSPYLLFIITFSVAQTWGYLRKLPVEITKPSNHTIIVKFSKGLSNPFAGTATTISLDPLTEWHSFATIEKPGEEGFRVIISRAGDWTSRVIDNPPSHFYIKGIATAGMARVGLLFSRVLYVATGSGIGPCLPHFLAKEVPSHLFWSTRTPADTFGENFVNEILEAVPDAVIHDTVKLGKPDMVERTYALWKHFNCEAVVVISNQKLTRKIVYGMESRGIPAFGAIWDS